MFLFTFEIINRKLPFNILNINIIYSDAQVYNNRQLFTNIKKIQHTIEMVTSGDFFFLLRKRKKACTDKAHQKCFYWFCKGM